MADFKFALRETLEAEGGFSDHPRDPGSATRYGITEAVARRHGYSGDMRELPLDLAVAIYEADYWRALRLDGISSRYVAASIFSVGVNQGVTWGAYGAQLAARLVAADERDEMSLDSTAWEDVARFEALPISRAVDGRMGPATVAALNGVATRYELALLAGIALWQGIRYMGTGIDACREMLALAEASQSRDAFLRGWLGRSVGMIQAWRDAQADPSINAGAIA